MIIICRSGLDLGLLLGGLCGVIHHGDLGGNVVVLGELDVELVLLGSGNCKVSEVSRSDEEKVEMEETW